MPAQASSIMAARRTSAAIDQQSKIVTHKTSLTDPSINPATSASRRSMESSQSAYNCGARNLDQAGALITGLISQLELGLLEINKAKELAISATNDALGQTVQHLSQSFAGIVGSPNGTSSIDNILSSFTWNGEKMLYQESTNAYFAPATPSKIMNAPASRLFNNVTTSCPNPVIIEDFNLDTGDGNGEIKGNLTVAESGEQFTLATTSIASTSWTFNSPTSSRTITVSLKPEALTNWGIPTSTQLTGDQVNQIEEDLKEWATSNAIQPATIAKPSYFTKVEVGNDVPTGSKLYLSMIDTTNNIFSLDDERGQSIAKAAYSNGVIDFGIAKITTSGYSSTSAAATLVNNPALIMVDVPSEQTELNFAAGGDLRNDIISVPIRTASSTGLGLSGLTIDTLQNRQESMDKLNEASGKIEKMIAELGANLKRINLAKDTAEEMANNLNQAKEAFGRVDLVDEFSKLKESQNQLQRIYALYPAQVLERNEQNRLIQQNAAG